MSTLKLPEWNASRLAAAALPRRFSVTEGQEDFRLPTLLERRHCKDIAGPSPRKQVGSELQERTTLDFIKDAGRGAFQYDYSDMCLGPDGMFYCAPWNSSKVLVINPVDKSIKFIHGAGTGKCKYSGICVGPDGLLYCSPGTSSRVLVIDPVKQDLSFIDGAGEGMWKYRGICVGPDGLMYCAPVRSSSVLVVDPERQRLGFIALAGGWCSNVTKKYSGICLGPDRLLYCSPANASNVLVIDPHKKSVRRIEEDIFPDGDNRSGQADNRYMGICLAPDGLLYCAPWNTSKVMVIHPVTRSIRYIGRVRGVRQRYRSICVGPGGLLYCPPFNGSEVLVIDPKTDQLDYIDVADQSRGKFSGVCLGPDGKSLYFVPYCSSKVMVVSLEENRANDETKQRRATICGMLGTTRASRHETTLGANN